MNLDALDQLLELELVQSHPGKLKARCTISSFDRKHQDYAHAKLRELMDPEAASKVLTTELAKSLKKGGNMLPKYGIQVTMRRGARRASQELAEGLAFGHSAPAVPS
jgi:hypothetical protein